MLSFILEIARRLGYLFNRGRFDAELREEMETHAAMLSKDEDTVSARRRIGNLTRWQEISRDAWGWGWLESLIRDVSYGVRLLARSPGFTLTACLSLAIGLGATMGIFSLTNALEFKHLPVPAPQQLWDLAHGDPGAGDDNFSYPVFTALRRFNNTGVRFFAFGGDYVQADFGGSVRNTPALIVSGDAFRILQLSAYAGRPLNVDDDIRGIPHGANCVLSYRLWESRFHRDPAAIGSHINIGAVRFTVVGIAPPRFFGLYIGAYSDLILPLAAYAATNPAQKILDASNWTWLTLAARVPPSTTVQQLTAALNTAYPAILRESRFTPPASGEPDRLYLESLATGVSAVRQRFSAPLYVLLTMTSLILLIACANVANLLLARSVVRHREVAMRLSLGANRGRVMRQLLTESGLIALIGATASVPIYLACTRGLIAFLQSGADSNIFLDISPDWRFIGAALAAICFTMLLFGLAPALRVTRCDLNVALAEGSSRLTRKASFGKFIVAVQISLSLILLLGASLLARSLYDLRTFNPGFRRDHLLIADVDTSQTIHKNAKVVRFFDDLMTQARGLPGARSVAASVVVPLAGRSWQNDYRIGTRVNSSVKHSFENWVTPGYFETLGTPLMLGRNLAEADTARSPHVAVVNEVFARDYLGRDPIGRQIYLKGKSDAITVVGIVGDARYRGLRDAAPPTVYRPVAQLPESFEFLLTMNLELWTATPASALTEPVRALVKNLDNRAFLNTQTFDSMIDANLLYERLLTALSIAFGVIGLLLSAIGIYGLSAYSVARRTSELGIRMALGATPALILRLVLSEHLRLLAIGLSTGLAISIALTRFLRAWLFGVSATDPFVFLAALLILGTIAMAAAFVPARRAARLNPVMALRYE